MPFLDPTLYPNGVPEGAIEYEDVFSPAFGRAKTWSDHKLAWQVQPVYQKPLANIDRIDLTASGDTHTVNVHYPAGAGPLVTRFNRYGKVIPGQRDRVNETRILQAGNLSEKLRTVSIPQITGRTFSIRSVYISSGDIVERCRFTTFEDQNINLWWGGRASAFNDEYSVPGRALSAITVWQRNRSYNSKPSVMLFSFSHDPKLAVSAATRDYDITRMSSNRSGFSPKGRSLHSDSDALRSAFWQRVKEIATRAEAGQSR